MSEDYDKAKALGLTDKDRWGERVPHHPMSERLMKFLKAHDREHYGRVFDWRTGGDGDDGETLMYQMDAFFEMMSQENKE